MNGFDPPELRAEVEEALHLLERTLGDDVAELRGDFIDPRDPDFDPSEHDAIRPDHVVSLSLPRCEYSTHDVTYGGLRSFARKVEQSVLVDNVECWSPQSLLLRVENSGDVESLQALQSLVESRRLLASVDLRSNGTAVQCRLVEGLTVFGFLVVKNDDFDKYFPPVLVEDNFLEFEWDGTQDRDTIKQVVEAVIFELSASYSLHLRRAPRPQWLEWFTENEGGGPDFEGRPVRPIQFGRGLCEAQSLYNRASATDDPEFQLLGFVKVLNATTPGSERGG